MSDWRQHIITHHQLDYADTPESLRLGEPASEESIAAFEASVGYVLPGEFHDLYQQFDGYGNETQEGVDWFFVPLEFLPEHVAGVRDWFESTHSALARRFVPFVDWGNGDASGYLFTESGEQEPGIFMFEHESYEFNEAQDWSDFLYLVDDNLQDFLTT
ncbi:MAG: SMI1/KNR4 family protein [Verrucomicrobiaceae bacterium]|nr:MAG: SMI1/KNR4 family protein [Verrucomicrobiaceae bacterium]